MSKQTSKKDRKENQHREPGDFDRPLISNGVGAADDNSGSGNATGIPDAESAMRPGGNPPEGNVEEDRKKLFPEKS